MFSAIADHKKSAGYRPPETAARGNSFPAADVTANPKSGHNYRNIPLYSQKPALQAKLFVNTPGDKYEQEADKVANSITATNRTATGWGSQSHRKGFSQNISPLLQTKGAPARSVSPALNNKITSANGSGSKLHKETNSFMSNRIGADFGNVKIHADEDAARMSNELNARAFTVGQDIYFNRGEYEPASETGKHLLAHELTHTIQQRSSSGTGIQMTSLTGFKDPAKPLNDPSRLTDAQIEATDEFKAYMDSSLVWQWKDKVTKEEALLACKLMLRAIREGKNITWSSDARVFMNMARKSIGVVTKTETMVGQDSWVPFSSRLAVNDPSKLDSEFSKWLLTGGPEPKGTVDKMNCWEAVLSGSFRGGFISKVRLVDIYDRAVDNVKKGAAISIGDTVETELKGSNEHILDVSKATTTEQPLRGDMIIFSTAAAHAAISLGTINAAGEHEILSLWNYDGKRPNLERTTIETLLGRGAAKPVKFWTVKW